jgi:hypothetical protein
LCDKLARHRQVNQHNDALRWETASCLVMLQAVPQLSQPRLQMPWRVQRDGR